MSNADRTCCSRARQAGATEDFFYEVASGKTHAPCTLSGTALGRTREMLMPVTQPAR